MRRVLVVDDREENCYYLTALLRGAGFEVDSARHGAEALIKARQHVPSLVISDLLMPVMDGYTLLRHWRGDARLRGVPFIVYTATYTNPEDERLALRLGADAFILKPAEPEIFLGRIRELEGAPVASPQSPGDTADEKALLREYSETLIRKLEEKTLQLEESNRSLHKDMAARALAEAALRESEEKFRLLTEAMPQLVWSTQPDGANTFINQRWVEYTGLSVEESLGHGWRQCVHPEDAARLNHVWTNASQAGAAWEVEARLRGRDGQHRWWLVRAVPFRDAGGAVSKWFGTCTDIDGLKRAEAKLRRTEEQLLQAQKMEAIGQLAGGVAHDFNNLLTVIISYASFVSSELGPQSPLQPDVDEILRAGERAVALTRQLLTFSRQQILQVKPVRVNALLQGLEKMLRRLIGESISLSLSCEGAVGAVLADPGQLEQVVMNLVVNARDAMPQGGRLTIESDEVDLDAAYAAEHHGVNPGRYVRITVSDTGHGMDSTTLSHIYEPFFATKEKGRGTGLGLAIVYGVVSQSGGHISVESTPGQGTTFRLHFPAHSGEAREESTGVVPRASRFKGTETVLVVEDDDPLRALIRSVLRRNGYQVLDAPNAGEALLLCEQETREIHLLLTDVVLPRVGGRELAERLTRSRPAMKTLFMSGYATDAGAPSSSSGPFLAKPLTPETLLRGVRATLDGDDLTPTPAAPPLETEAHILHVDDEEALVMLTGRVLRGMGYRVTGFTSPVKALEAFLAAPQEFSALVTDISMPKMSGFDLVRQIRQVRPDIPVVLTSGYFTPRDLLSAAELRLHTLVVKPDTVEELGRALREQLQGPRTPRS